MLNCHKKLMFTTGGKTNQCSLKLTYHTAPQAKLPPEIKCTTMRIHVHSCRSHTRPTVTYQAHVVSYTRPTVSHRVHMVSYQAHSLTPVHTISYQAHSLTLCQHNLMPASLKPPTGQTSLLNQEHPQAFKPHLYLCAIGCLRDDLGCHPERCPHKCLPLVHRLGELASNTKVSKLDVPLCREQHVCGCGGDTQA